MTEPEALIEILGKREPKLTVGWRLRVRSGAAEESCIELSNETVTIGRADANDIHPDDSQLSRFHARIARENGAWVASDLSSKNGTSVNGRAIDRHTLQPGDLIQAGETIVVFERGEGGQSSAEPILNYAGGPALDALLGFGEMLACAEDEMAVFEEVASRVRDVVVCERATIILVEEGSGRPLMQYSHQDTLTGESEELGGVVLQRALEVEQPCLETIPGIAPLHVLLAPLQARYRKAGVLVMERGSSGRPFVEAELQYASIAAAHITTFLRSLL